MASGSPVSSQCVTRLGQQQRTEWLAGQRELLQFRRGRLRGTGNPAPASRPAAGPPTGPPARSGAAAAGSGSSDSANSMVTMTKKASGCSHSPGRRKASSRSRRSTRACRRQRAHLQRITHAAASGERQLARRACRAMPGLVRGQKHSATRCDMARPGSQPALPGPPHRDWRPVHPSSHSRAPHSDRRASATRRRWPAE